GDISLDQTATKDVYHPASPKHQVGRDLPLGSHYPFLQPGALCNRFKLGFGHRGFFLCLLSFSENPSQVKKDRTNKAEANFPEERVKIIFLS
ncbi:MAG TPA: hypothetical protein DCY27_01155, partial [Desulfobacterales bacterium]|nr:hypothetical protein [Desulfobacterales bacterium]